MGYRNSEGEPAYQACLSADTQAEIQSLLASTTPLNFSSVSEDMLVRWMLDALRRSKRPNVQRQLLRDLAEMRGALEKRAGKSTDDAKDALGRLGSTPKPS